MEKPKRPEEGGTAEEIYRYLMEKEAWYQEKGAKKINQKQKQE